MIIILGSKGGLGSGLVELLKSNSKLVEPYSGFLAASREDVDVESESSVREFFTELDRQAAPGSPLYIVNACGISVNGLVSKYSLSDWQKTISGNLTSSFLIARESALLFKSRHHSSLLFFSSVVSSFGIPGTSAYAATKGALKSFVQTCAQEFGRSHSRVNALELGYFDRGMIDQVNDTLKTQTIESTALKRLGTTEDLFNACDFALRCKYLTGSVIKLDGGLA